MNADEQRVEAAGGYIMLGMWKDAKAELDDLPVVWRTRGEVLRMRIDIYMGEQQWKSARVLSESLARREPDNPKWWILWACSLRHEKSAADAQAVLMEASKLHPEEPLIPYNIACYLCLEGNVRAATVYLHQAFTMEPRLSKTAYRDPDLAELWKQMAD